MDYFKNHLCGSYHDKKTHCEHFVYADKPDMTIGKK